MQTLQLNAVEEPKSKEVNNSQELQPSMQRLQNSLVLLEGENENLKSYNNNLHKIANDRTLAFNEMKEERNLWLNKYENLQSEHNHIVLKDFFKKYYLVL